MDVITLNKYTIENLSKYSYFNSFNLGIDYLTGVLDRRSITSLIQSQIKNKKSFGIAICDFDNFKRINDGYGHFYGDIALKEVAGAMVEATKDVGLVGRFGGDEFLIYFDDSNDYDDLWKKIKNVSEAIKAIKFEEPLDNLNVTQTVGAARFPFDSDNYEDLFKKADKALYRGKSKGRNCFIIYKDEIHKHIDVVNSSPVLTAKNTLINAYSILKTNASIDEKIEYIFKTISDEYGADHICINTEYKIENDYVKPGNSKVYYKVDNNEFRKMMKDGIYYTKTYSDYKEVSPIAHEELYEQGVKAIFTYELIYNGESFGIVRIEDSKVKRVWQEHEVLTYISALNAVALLKYLEKHME